VNITLSAFCEPIIKMSAAQEARTKTHVSPRRHQDTKKISEFSLLSRTFVTFAPEAHEPLAQCLGGTTFRLDLKKITQIVTNVNNTLPTVGS